MSGTGNLDLPVAELVSTIQRLVTETETVRYDWNSLSTEMHGAEPGWGGESTTAAATLDAAFDTVGSALLTVLTGFTEAVISSIDSLAAVDGSTAAALTAQTGA
ncbi:MULTISPECIES: hypothetical protein [Nocardia]|jgi:hypothetical protein|uniref:hypothetical protein n=1 Tax=Nocardia TaxID=1817 RepID=UPI00292CF1F3|nr:hypothetical protein [Nocardia canadensis]